MNTVGSQLSVNKLDDAVKHLEQHFNIKIKEYTICAKRYHDEFYHSWYFGTEDHVENEQLAKSIDAFLKKANKILVKFFLISKISNNLFKF